MQTQRAEFDQSTPAQIKDINSGEATTSARLTLRSRSCEHPSKTAFLLTVEMRGGILQLKDFDLIRCEVRLSGEERSAAHLTVVGLVCFGGVN